MRSLIKPRSKRRKGAAAVEFAIIAPLLVTVVLGVSEVGRLFDIQTELAIAAREGARLASMDHTELLRGDQTTNEKITEDVKNFLTANGLAGDDMQVFIVDPIDHQTVFDLDDPNNDLRLFELRIAMPYSAMIGIGGQQSDYGLSSKVVFRNGRAIIAQ